MSCLHSIRNFLLLLVLFLLSACSVLGNPDMDRSYHYSGGRAWQTSRRMVDGRVEIFDGIGRHDCGISTCDLEMTWTNRRTGERFISRKKEILGGHTWLCPGDSDDCSDSNNQPGHEDVLPGREAGMFEE